MEANLRPAKQRIAPHHPVVPSRARSDAAAEQRLRAEYEYGLAHNRPPFDEDTEIERDTEYIPGTDKLG